MWSVCTKLIHSDHDLIQVHRRTVYDDKRGVGEPLNETGRDGKGLIIRGSHYALLNNITNAAQNHRLLGEALMLKPYMVFVRDTSSYKDWIKKYRTTVRDESYTRRRERANGGGGGQAIRGRGRGGGEWRYLSYCISP